MSLILVQVQRHENTYTQTRKLFFRSQVHLSRRTRPANVQMMKRDGGLDHSLKKQFFGWSNFTHPALFPRVVRRVKFTGIVKINPGDVLDRIRGDVSVEISGFAFGHRVLVSALGRPRRATPTVTSNQRVFNRAAITLAAVAPAPVALLTVGANGFDTSPIAKTIGTLVSC